MRDKSPLSAVFGKIKGNAPGKGGDRLNKKALFIDVDGTLISFGTHRVPASAAAALHAARAAGHRLFLATGRPKASLEHLAPILNFEFDGYIAMNGQFVYTGDRVLYDHPLPTTEIEALIPFMNERHIACQFVELERCYFNFHNERSRRLKDALGDTFYAKGFETLTDGLPAPVYMICPAVTDEEEGELLAFLPSCKSERWNALYTDVIHKDCGKDVGLRLVRDAYGFAPEDCLAFGDGGNDVAMLREAGLGVAMANACEAAKKEADLVTDHVDEDGLYKAFDSLGLLG